MDNLDSKELLHLAMHASSQNRHDDAIKHLKQAIAIAPEDAFSNFLLAAEYASIALYDRALEFFEKTTQLAPELYVARLQWGLLLTALNQTEEAVDVLKSLKELDDNNCYKLFADGLNALINEQLPEAKSLIQTAIENNDENQPLNLDFEKIITEIDKKIESGDKVDDDESDKGNANSFLLSSYNK